MQAVERIREQIAASEHDQQTVAALRSMEGSHLEALTSVEGKREKLRTEWRRNQELCMQAFTTVVYHGSMFGELRSHWDSNRTGHRGPRDETRAVHSARSDGTGKTAGAGKGAIGIPNPLSATLTIAQASAAADSLRSLHAPSLAARLRPSSASNLRVPAGSGSLLGQSGCVGAKVRKCGDRRPHSAQVQRGSRQTLAQNGAGEGEGDLLSPPEGRQPQRPSGSAPPIVGDCRCAYSANSPLLPFSSKPLPQPWAESQPVVSIAGHSAHGVTPLKASRSSPSVGAQCQGARASRPGGIATSNSVSFLSHEANVSARVGAAESSAS